MHAYMHAYLHTYIPTYLPTYLPIYLHSHYITLYYITLLYFTLHDMSLHTVHASHALHASQCEAHMAIDPLTDLFSPVAAAGPSDRPATAAYTQGGATGRETPGPGDHAVARPPPDCRPQPGCRTQSGLVAQSGPRG